MAHVSAGCASSIANSSRESPAAAVLPFPRSRHLGWDIVVAFGLFSVAFALRLLLVPWLGDTFIFMFFSPVVALAAWYRGRRCGLIATLLSAATIAFVWLPDFWSIELRDLDDVFHVAAFVGIGFLLTHFLGRGRDAMLTLHATAEREIQAQRELLAANARLEEQILELRRTEAALLAAQEELSQANAHLEQRVEERTAAQAALSTEMESFAYTVSHDLRSPLRAVTGFAEALNEDHAPALSDEARDLITRIVRGANRMDRLITDLLAYSRVNRHSIDLGPVSVADCVRQAIQNAPELQSPRAEIEIAGSLPTVMAAESLLLQVFANLLGNATKFVPAGRTPCIRIHAEPADDGVRVWISDNGIGIRSEFLPRLFRLFERLDAGRNYEGTGMGLAIVRRALARMGGTVGAESDGQTGSRFWLQLKLAESGVVIVSAPLAAAV